MLDPNQPDLCLVDTQTQKGRALWGQVCPHGVALISEGRELGKAETPAPGLSRLWGLAGPGKPQGRSSPAALPPPLQTPQVSTPYHLEGASSVGGSDLAILSRTRMGLSSW